MNNQVNEIKKSPGEYIITYQGDFVRIKDELKFVDKNLKIIRAKLKATGRFNGETDKSYEQICKERYDGVLELVNFDYGRFHD